MGPPGRGILIVDEHPILRQGLAHLIESEPDLSICGQVSTGAAALGALGTTQPDLVIVELRLAGGDGLLLLKDIKARHPTTPVLVLSAFEESNYGVRSLRAGASGYISKQQSSSTVLVAVRCVLGGQIYMSHQLEAQLAAKYLGGQTLATSAVESLTDRQLEAFRLVGQGLSTREIAKSLHLSVKTIETHREHLKHKLDLGSAVELARFATEWALSNHSG